MGLYDTIAFLYYEFTSGERYAVTFPAYCHAGTCVVSMTQAQTVTATFAGTHNLTVLGGGSGDGSANGKTEITAAIKKGAEIFSLSNDQVENIKKRPLKGHTR